MGGIGTDHVCEEAGVVHDELMHYAPSMLIGSQRSLVGSPSGQNLRLATHGWKPLSMFLSCWAAKLCFGFIGQSFFSICGFRLELYPHRLQKVMSLSIILWCETWNFDELPVGRVSDLIILGPRCSSTMVVRLSVLV